jgi:hypothetical protein
MNLKFVDFIFSKITILKFFFFLKVYKTLNKLKTLSQLENKIKIWNYKKKSMKFKNNKKIIKTIKIEFQDEIFKLTED